MFFTHVELSGHRSVSFVPFYSDHLFLNYAGSGLCRRNQVYSKLSAKQYYLVLFILSLITFTFRSSARVVCILNHWANFQPPKCLRIALCHPCGLLVKICCDELGWQHLFLAPQNYSLMFTHPPLSQPGFPQQ